MTKSIIKHKFWQENFKNKNQKIIMDIKIKLIKCGKIFYHKEIWEGGGVAQPATPIPLRLNPRHYDFFPLFSLPVKFFLQV